MGDNSRRCSTLDGGSSTKQRRRSRRALRLRRFREALQFRCDNEKLQGTYNASLSGLKNNVQDVFRFPRPVLLEGATYAGVWLECAPLEGLVYAPISPETALANHEVFFDLQREDGYLPCNAKKDRLGTGQIQMVVPIAATAWDLYRQNRNAAFLEKAYRACSRWDEWLIRYRNTRGTGLCRHFAPTIRGTITARVSWGSRASVQTPMRACVRKTMGCRIWRPTFRRQFTADGLHWRRWHAR